MACKRSGLFTAALLAGLAMSPVACGQQTQPEDWREVMRDEGLTAAADLLAAQEMTPEVSFATGGVEFLRALEHVLQVRYATSAEPVPLLPGLGTDLPRNPDGAFDPAFLEDALVGAIDHLSASEAALAEARRGEFAVEINLNDVWFDIDRDGARSDWEGLTTLFGQLGMAPDEDAAFDGRVRFDTADAHWLSAYTHLLMGTSELALSFDPTPAIREVYEGRAMIEAAIADQGEINGIFIEPDQLDTIAAALRTLDGVPDRRRTRAARDHWLEMIAENRQFWTEVAMETDDDREWLPNPSQTSAFGVEVTGEMADSWQRALDEFEAVLQGELLIPFWRVRQDRSDGEGVGINLNSVLTDPTDMNLILIIQGTAFAPHLETGPLTEGTAMENALSAFPGNPFAFALWFN